MGIATKQKGFTIVELLIVIVVIAILATISIVAYSGVQQRAQVSALADGFKKIEKAFRLTAIDGGQPTWWNDKNPALYDPSVCTDSASCPGNPRVADVIVAMPTIQKYLQQEPKIGSLSGTFKYDNDGGSDLAEPTCSQQVVNGVNIYFSSVTQDIAQALDDKIDDGVLTTGHLGFNNGNQIFYKISCTQGF